MYIFIFFLFFSSLFSRVRKVRMFPGKFPRARHPTIFQKKIIIKKKQYFFYTVKLYNVFIVFFIFFHFFDSLLQFPVVLAPCHFLFFHPMIACRDTKMGGLDPHVPLD